MKKAEIRKELRKIKGAKEKESFLYVSGIKFSHDSSMNLIIFCDDGVLIIAPEWRGKK